MDVLCGQFGVPELLHTRLGLPVSLRRVEPADGALLGAPGLLAYLPVT